MTYPDIVKLATTTYDGYGDNTITALDEVQAIFIKRARIEHVENKDGEVSDAAVYLSPTNNTVLSVKEDLEGMYIVYEDTNWYRITSVNIAQRKLLDNAIDNIYCRLEKVAGIAYVS